MSVFDTAWDRRSSGCNKWNRYEADVLPMWVADMDFAVPPAVSDALAERLRQPILGYGMRRGPLLERIAAWMAAQYGWAVPPEAIVPLAGVVPGFNLALRATCAPGSGVVLQTPLYPPMRAAPAHWDLRRIEAPLTPADEVDMDAFGAAIRQAGQGAFILCNPHNPTGRVFRREELLAMACACVEAGVAIVSDEIHCDLVFDGRRHIPVASLSPEIAARTITLMSAGKTFNIAGLAVCWAVVTDPALRARFQAAIAGVSDHPNILGLIATEAALEHGEPWRQELLAYLRDNRDWLFQAVERDLPGVRMNLPEGTYLAWLDCRGSQAAADPAGFFVERARVAMNPGPDFGAAGQGFARFNFGCRRATLEEAVARMAAALRN
ncbi:MalY/PatB family protein [Falsiroseomonas sp. HW251]|uniref:MalY/PatB family protein n=1 Tax=Falsiroseomonas sp. HW251 TaxID=3390998 RepID=UPI003D321C42